MTNYYNAIDDNLGTYLRCIGQISVRYHTWQAPEMAAYNALAVAVVYSVTSSTNADPWTISYSTDGGATWSILDTGTGLSTFDPDTAVLPVITDLSTLQVKVDCPATKTIRIYEIYTLGCFYGPASLVVEGPRRRRAYEGPKRRRAYEARR